MNTIIVVPRGPRGPSNQELIEKEIAKRDYADLSKRDLALSIGLYGVELGEQDKTDERHLGWILVGLFAFFIGFGLAIFIESNRGF